MDSYIIIIFYVATLLIRRHDNYSKINNGMLMLFLDILFVVVLFCIIKRQLGYTYKKTWKINKSTEIVIILTTFDSDCNLNNEILR